MPYLGEKSIGNNKKIAQMDEGQTSFVIFHFLELRHIYEMYSTLLCQIQLKNYYANSCNCEQAP